jgi:hypothetical protein
MARFRLRTAHALYNREINNAPVVVNGDQENEHMGPDKGTIVGTGTPYPIVSATQEMIPLDEEAEQMIAAEEERLARAMATMNPLERLPMTLEPRDDYDDRYVPGFPGTRRPQAKPEPVQKAARP